MNSNRTILTLLALLSCLVFCTLTIGQDIIVTRNFKTGKTVERKGRIVEWLGDTLTFETQSGERNYDGSEIVESKTAWSTEFVAGRKAIAEGNFEMASEQLTAALSSEVRPWARRIIRANLIEVHGIRNETALMLKHFLDIVREDPETRFIGRAPLPWTSARADLAIEKYSSMNSKTNVRRLIGASWSMAGHEREVGLKILSELTLHPPFSGLNAIQGLGSSHTRKFDDEVFYLAQSMIWKNSILSADLEQVGRWEVQLNEMPRDLRAGPQYVIAEAKSRLKQTDSAAIDYLKIPVLYPDRHNLVAASLYKCGNLLHNEGRTAEAKKLWRELVQKYPKSIWATQVADKL